MALLPMASSSALSSCTCRRTTTSGRLHRTSRMRRLSALQRSSPLASASASAPAAKKAPSASVVNVGTASLGVFLFGFHLAVINAALSQMSASLGGLSLQQQGSIVSTALLGAAVGSFAGGWFADVLGRVRAFALSGCTLALGGFLCATCASLPTLLAGRSLCGVGIGVASSVVPIFLTEVSPPGAAGLVGSANQLTINIGILFALVIGALTAQTPEGWRNAFWFSCFPALLFASSPFLLREPQPQPTQSEQQPAQQEQQQHGGRENGPIDPEAKQQPQEEQPSEEQQSSWMDLLFGWPGRLALCVSIFCLQQLAGVNAIIFFSSSFFAAAGLSNATMASALIGVCNIIGTSCAASYMDRVGRKPLLAGSFACMATCMVVLGMAITRPLMCLSFTLLYILAFACGAGPIPAIIISDILPPELRGKAASLALSFHWIANAVVGQLFLPAVNQYGFSSVFNFFAAFAASATLLVLFKLPETIGQQKPALAD